MRKKYFIIAWGIEIRILTFNENIMYVRYSFFGVKKPKSNMSQTNCT